MRLHQRETFRALAFMVRLEGWVPEVDPVQLHVPTVRVMESLGWCKGDAGGWLITDLGCDAFRVLTAWTKGSPIRAALRNCRRPA